MMATAVPSGGFHRSLNIDFQGVEAKINIYFKRLIGQYLFFCNLHVTGTAFPFKQTLKLLQIIVSQGDAIMEFENRAVSFGVSTCI